MRGTIALTIVALLSAPLRVIGSNLPCPVPPAPGRFGPQCPENWERIGNKCYLFWNDPKNQKDATSTCRWNGGTLAAVHSQEENDLILSRATVDKWIGFMRTGDNGTFEWMDGSPVDYTNWNDGEPSSSDEVCVELLYWPDNPAANGKWNDIACDNGDNSFACSIDLEYECSKYRSCEWSGSQCNMRDFGRDTGYLIDGPVEDTGNGFRVPLKRAPNSGMYPEFISDLIFEAYFYTEYHLRFKLYDANNDRYEVPLPLDLVEDGNLNIDNTLYEMNLLSESMGDAFGFTITRRATGSVIFDTSVSPLVFDDQFLQISTKLTPECSLYGFGENPHAKFRHDFAEDRIYPMFSRDEFPTDGEKNLYGVHPYYQCMEDAAGNTHGVMLLNSNAMEYGLFKTPEGTPVVTLRSIGGILDFHMFMGPMPADVTRQYLEMIGRPFLPPYWAFGFQISRWGYESLEKLQEVVDRTKAAGIPQDIQYCDIDYMEEFKDFTYDKVKWADLPNYVREVKEGGLRFVLILDPAIVIDFSENYPAAQRADEADVFIKWPDQSWIPEDQPADAKDYMIGYVWPNEKTAFPDFWKNSTQQWWINELQILHDTIPYDGIWIDMNEPSNFGTNLQQPWNWPEGKEPWSLKCLRENQWDFPPYRTKVVNTGDNQSGQLTDKTICMVGTHYDDTTDPSNPVTRREYDVHSLYGWRQAEPTMIGAREATGHRSMVFSRSTYPSSGKIIGHWYGDNSARWADLHRSIIYMFEFEMFGMPYGGADICGFLGDSWEELCLRWMQLGSFYPFSRNHNAIGNIEQDPALWDSVAQASRSSLGVRYTLLPYLYTLFFNSHTKGDTVVRPLTYEYPSDLTARDIDTQFMWGPHLLFSPILFEESYNSRPAYFPKGLWYNYFGKELEFEGPIEVQLEVPDMAIPIHLRGGGIIPTQQPALNTKQSRQNPLGLIVALDENKQANGEFFWDDGESEETVESGSYHLGQISFSMEDGLQYTVINDFPATLYQLHIQDIEILGWEGETTPGVETNFGEILDIALDASKGVLHLSTDIPAGQPFNVSFSAL